ncbi:SusC/RagA family TonB-linked outer membrane protein [Hufsiella ginkgonis]|uniref:SusC/RagA family TonB-linked outer membrane protein n=1 Tax=Hufsiella ginkgonis TaxID=2695274 RepID=A0A7K1XSR6_9SPHI|nr:TonB-dependent receptor [Hufsiella ginkgonis]MXV14053.1 SusC/RagA family TonB-linked outer membrane protein [Hufsiella ginkgonis]
MSLKIYAQNITVNGKVFDESGQPLIGAAIKVKAGTPGTSTNTEGQFSIQVAPGTVLTISYLGFVSKDVPVTSTTRDLNIKLEPDNKNLEEVVVVGYGTQTKGTLTGAVSNVSAKDIVKNTNSDVTNTLTGRAPGVRITQLSSQPGSYDTQIDIRGFSGVAANEGNVDGALTIGGPLIIVDGVQRDKSGFDRLDPNEIESISVLKDATAAIYGVQAANGVLLITTKKGKSGKVKISYSTRLGQQHITKYPELSNAYQYAVLYDELQTNANISSRSRYTPPRFTAEEIEKYRTGELGSVDYLRTVLSPTTTQQQHNLNLSGGTDKLRFFASGGFFNDGGLYTTGIDWGKKYNGRLNMDAEVLKGLTFNMNVSFINTVSQGASGSTLNFLKNAWRVDPTEPLYSNNDPLYPKKFLNTQTTHPLAEITKELSGYRKVNDKFLTSTFELKYSIPWVKGLAARTQFAYDNRYNLNKTFVKRYNTYSYLYNSATATYYQDPSAIGNASTLNEPFGQTTRKFMQGGLNYNHRFGRHNVGALALVEQTQRENRSHETSTQYVIDAVDQLNAGSRATDKVNSSFSQSANLSYVGKTNYDFAGRYLAEFGFRYDGSSRFPKNSRWGFFPYVSAGWRISEEPFIKKKIPFMDNLKIRATYGVLGDDGAADYQWLTGFTYPGGGNRGAQFGNDYVNGVDFKNSPNNNITWYTSTTSNIGLDASFWNGKLSLEADVFRRDRDGLLTFRNTSVPDTYGVTLPQVNLNEDRTQGFELVLGHRNNVGQVSYSISANMSYARTLNRYREELPATSDYDRWRNRSRDRYNDVVFGYRTAGQFQNFEEIFAWPQIDDNGNRTLLPGDIKLVDINGDGVVNTLDQVVIGRGGSKPAIYFATNMEVSWKGFDLSTLFQGATMYQVKYEDQLSRPFYFEGANPINTFFDRWHREDVFNLNSPWVAGRWPATGQRAKQYDTNTFRRFDATYLRIKELTLGYTLPTALTRRIRVDNLRIFGTCYNLYTFHGGLDFVDPEFTDDRAYGYNYPLTRNMNLGIQVNF